MSGGVLRMALFLGLSLLGLWFSVAALNATYRHEAALDRWEQRIKARDAEIKAGDRWLDEHRRKR